MGKLNPLQKSGAHGAPLNNKKKMETKHYIIGITAGLIMMIAPAFMLNTRTITIATMQLLGAILLIYTLILLVKEGQKNEL